MIAALAGRRIDGPAPGVCRFPSDRIDMVKRAIQTRLREDGVRALVCAAACGADLLALEAAGELGIRRHIVLPFPVKVFKEGSVTDRECPLDFGKLYDRFVREAQDANDLRLLELNADDPQAYEKTNEAILDDARAIASAQEDEVEALAVWDKRLQSEHDYTAHFIHQAERRHVVVRSIPILDA